jgi:hypothetical protein
VVGPLRTVPGYESVGGRPRPDRRELARSPYSIDELDAILLWEVYPACRSNLVALAGEWLAFDPEWLESRIVKGPSAIGIAWAATVGRLGRLTSVSWGRLKGRIKSMRAAEGGA